MTAGLDPFSERLVGDVSRRWNAARAAHQERERQAWLGVMLTEFTSHELQVLERAGSLSDNDRRLLRAAGRFGQQAREIR